MTAAGDFLPLRQLPPGKIAGAGIQNLALPHQLLHGLPDFVPGRLAVDMVHLVQIDAVGLKTPQTRFTGALDVQRREPRGIRPIPHAPVHLGRKHDLFPSTAALRKPTAENLFGPSLSELPPVDVRRVEKVHSQLQRTVHDRHAVRFGGLRPKIHGAETEPAHLDARAPQLYVLHGFPQRQIPMVSIRPTSSRVSVKRSARKSSAMCCAFVVPVNGTMPICMANRNTTWATPVPYVSAMARMAGSIHTSRLAVSSEKP